MPPDLHPMKATSTPRVSTHPSLVLGVPSSPSVNDSHALIKPCKFLSSTIYHVQVPAISDFPGSHLAYACSSLPNVVIVTRWPLAGSQIIVFIFSNLPKDWL